MKQQEIDIEKLLGFANRAGKLAIGRFATLKAVKQKHANLLIISHDASEKIIRELHHISADLEIIRYGKKSELGLLFGRKEVGVVAVCDSQMAKSFRTSYKERVKNKSRS